MAKPNRTSNAMLAIHTTKEIVNQYRHMCKTSNLSQAGLLYRLMEGGTIVVINNVRDAWIELRKEGANLNQISYRLNAGDTVMRKEIGKALADNRRGVKELLDVLKALRKERSI